VKFINAAETQNEFLIQSELCSGGTLFDMITKYGGALKEAQTVFILKDIAKGLLHMHNLGVSHRDLKIENVLLHEKKFKLVDFGSAICGEDQGSIDERFENYEKYTTMMYRPPEMIDRYKNWTVSTKVDIWVRFSLD
jgi:AP2-associated kinase